MLVCDDSDVGEEVVDDDVDDDAGLDPLDPQLPNTLWLFIISKSAFVKIKAQKIDLHCSLVTRPSISNTACPLNQNLLLELSNLDQRRNELVWESPTSLPRNNSNLLHNIPVRNSNPQIRSLDK